MEAPQQTLEAAGNLRVLFAPVVAAGHGVELIGEAAAFEKCRESPVGVKQGFHLSGGEIDIRRSGRVGGMRQHEWIAIGPDRYTVC